MNQLVVFDALHPVDVAGLRIYAKTNFSILAIHGRECIGEMNYLLFVKESPGCVGSRQKGNAQRQQQDRRNY